MEIVLEFTRADYCDNAAARGAERINARTVRKLSDSGLDLFP